MAACLRFTRRVTATLSVSPCSQALKTNLIPQVWRSFVENKVLSKCQIPSISLVPGVHQTELKVPQNLVPKLQLHIVSAKPGSIETSLRIEPYNLNRVGTVHGGLIMSLTDTLGSLAIATKGQYMTGVSTDLGASFIRPAGGAGDILTAKAVVTAMGKSLAYTRVDFTNAAGVLVAYGHHTKYVGKSLKHEDNVKFSDDGEKVVEGQDVD